METAAVNIDESTVTLLNDLITESVSRHNELEVISASEVQQMADLSAERIAAGCDEESCLAEFASALDAQYVLLGKIGRLDKTLVLTLKLFDAKASKAVDRRTVKGMNRTVVMDQIDGAIENIIAPLLGKEPSEGDGVATVEAEGGGGLGGLFWTGAVLTVAGGAGAGIAGFMANESEKKALDFGGETVTDRQDALQNGQMLLIGSAVGAGVAILGLGLMGAGAM
jgi:TolB-like protein